MTVKTKINRIFIAACLIVMLSVTILPVSAANVYASGTTTITDTKTHYALIYNVPYNDFKNYYMVGGVATNLAMQAYLYPHSNPQTWTRVTYDNGRKSLLLIPERYTWVRPNYAREIYVYPSSTGGGGSW